MPTNPNPASQAGASCQHPMAGVACSKYMLRPICPTDRCPNGAYTMLHTLHILCSILYPYYAPYYAHTMLHMPHGQMPHTNMQPARPNGARLCIAKTFLQEISRDNLPLVAHQCQTKQTWQITRKTGKNVHIGCRMSTLYPCFHILTFVLAALTKAFALWQALSMIH